MIRQTKYGETLLVCSETLISCGLIISEEEEAFCSANSISDHARQHTNFDYSRQSIHVRSSTYIGEGAEFHWGQQRPPPR